MRIAACLPLPLILASLFPATAQEMALQSAPTDKQIEFFEKKIRPALIEHCFKCHSEDGDKIKGGLLLDTRESSRLGGDSGPAVVPFDLAESLLYVAVSYEDSSLEMPPKYKLDDEVIADFKAWIEMGAPDPRERKAEEAQHYTSTIDIEAGREHWAYRPPVQPEIPQPADEGWAKNPVDAFVRAAQERNHLSPAPDADPHTLLRRLSFDLTGLPPQAGEVGVFVQAYVENPDTAVSDVVDGMLDSPRFGERFGRRWLDVARYAESSGKEVNATFPHAWRYRDYVIDAFNADKPFDRFVTEQLAGDLLEAGSETERAENLVASGFLAIGVKGLNEQNARQFRFDLVDEQIDTTTQAFLATTVACARCHDHKFDPVPMSDYYAMAGIFLSSDALYGTAEALQSRRSTELIELPIAAASGGADKSLAEVIDMEFQRHTLQERLEELSAEAGRLRRDGDNEEATRVRLRILATRNRVGILDQVLNSYEDDGTRATFAMGMRDREEPFDSQILIRGEEDNPAEERARRGFVQVIRTNDEEAIPADESGRLQLSRWITSPENPLASRVFVNRVWSWLFGEGLVASVDNFGATGETPSHPALLDHLALRFVELDWSVKDLVREIATSRTYRMSSEFRPDYFEKDPENRFLWRANKRRLDAESIRDATLAASNRLDLSRPEGSPVSEAGPGFVGRNISESQINTETVHRSVYLPVVRGLLPESQALFDFADPSLISGKREVTTVPSQALYMMNSDFVVATAAAMADDLFHTRELRGAELVREAFHRCYSRPPTAEESRETLAYVQRFLATAQKSGMPPEEARRLALTTFCQSLVSSAEFRYLN
ncbi:MAG: PSD1 and planctomycete cytochrome C domain-containing protein [Verrucomicrobiales bacterium]